MTEFNSTSGAAAGEMAAAAPGCNNGSLGDNGTAALCDSDALLDEEEAAQCGQQELVGDTWFRAVLCCLYFVVFVFGVVGNVLVVLVSC